MELSNFSKYLLTPTLEAGVTMLQFSHKQGEVINA
jgi:hypothetical protein